MRDKQYKIKQFRLSEEVYEELLKLKAEKGKTWNLLLKELYEQRNSTNN